MSLKKIGVIGVGQMGSGIVQIAAQAGLTVVAKDRDEARNQKASAKIEKALEKLVAKEKITEEIKTKTLSNITWSTDLKDFSACDIVVEAISEDIPKKEELFKALDESCEAKTILATNTSSISVTRLAAVTQRPQKVIGMHFFNPVPVMKLLEVIRALPTNDETYQAVYDLGEQLKKQVVTVKDSAAFIVNRILIPFLNEAIYTLYEGIGTAEDIDKACKLGLNHPMGPLELSDFVGLDVVLAVLEVMQTEFGDPKYHPCPMLRKYVEAGWLGRKTGRGFYNYQ